MCGGPGCNRCGIEAEFIEHENILGDHYVDTTDTCKFSLSATYNYLSKIINDFNKIYKENEDRLKLVLTNVSLLLVYVER